MKGLKEQKGIDYIFGIIKKFQILNCRKINELEEKQKVQELIVASIKILDKFIDAFFERYITRNLKASNKIDEVLISIIKDENLKYDRDLNEVFCKIQDIERGIKLDREGVARDIKKIREKYFSKLEKSCDKGS